VLIDLDSQASMTSVFGGSVVADEWQTVFLSPAIMRKHLRSDFFQRRMDGATTGPADEDADREALGVTAQTLIRKPTGPNDLIGAQLVWAIPSQRMQGRGWKLWDALTDTLGRTACWTTTTSSSSIPLPSAPDDQRPLRTSCWSPSAPRS
jgi:chromosome partitioning protein